MKYTVDRIRQESEWHSVECEEIQLNPKLAQPLLWAMAKADGGIFFIGYPTKR